jgi:hypothetical protein
VELRFDRDVSGLDGAAPVLEDLPQGDLARELAEETLGPLAVVDGRWAFSVDAEGLRLFVTGDGAAFTIARAPEADESAATWAATRVHRALGGKDSEWDSDR